VLPTCLDGTERTRGVVIYLCLSMFTQVFYDSSDGARKFRKQTANCLEFWHTFKMGYHLLYRNFADFVFAPLFHHICPGHTFYKKPSRLIQIQEACLSLQLAYRDPVVRAEMAALLAKHCDVGSVAAAQRTVLINLRDLIEYFLPVVCCLSQINNAHK
jgi:hypothetical protein